MSNTINWDPIIAIKWALDDDGETQAALANKLGWPDGKLSKILNRKQGLLVRDLERISEAQGRDYSWYLGKPDVNRAKGVYRGTTPFALAV